MIIYKCLRAAEQTIDFLWWRRLLCYQWGQRT